MDIIFSKEFSKQIRKVKNKDIKLKIVNQLKKITNNPQLGKPLKYNLKNHRTIRVKPYRIIYRIESNKIIVVCFDHRKLIYEEILLLFGIYLL